MRRAGVKARTERPKAMTPAQAAELVRLESPTDVPGTLERLARLTLTGQLDARTANVAVLAAVHAMRAPEAAPVHREPEEARAKAAERAAKRAAYEATPEGQAELRDREATEAARAAFLANLDRSMFR